jgi:N-acetylmuramoyl-L-alanine amidase
VSAAAAGGALGVALAILAVLVGPLAQPGPAIEASIPSGPDAIELGLVDPADSPASADQAVAPDASAAPLATIAPAVGASGFPASPRATPTLMRVPKPVLPDGPRRIGIQAGHWLTELAPPELGRILTQTGTSWNGLNEREINLDIAQRIERILEGKGFVVDVLPTTVPPGYLADAFVSLHGDGDGTGANSGFKMAFSSRRTPYESALLQTIKDVYAIATGLPYDSARISSGMRGYYAHSWTRVKYSTAPFTPSVILEMGYVSNDHDRYLMTTKADVLASAIASGIVRFLEAHPRDKLFGQDLLVPQTVFRFATPSPAR